MTNSKVPYILIKPCISLYIQYETVWVKSQGEVDPGSILNNLIYATSPTTTISYYLKPRKISEDLRPESFNRSPAVDVDYQR